MPGRLIELFRRLGARNPERWVETQGTEPKQLHRYLFLRQAWSLVVSEDDDKWIDNLVTNSARSPSGPYADVGSAVRQMLDAGVDRRIITDLVRGMQAELLFGFCYLLEDPALAEPEFAGIGWQLVETDANGNPTGVPISALHESVLETDPTGREMGPRGPE